MSGSTAAFRSTSSFNSSAPPDDFLRAQTHGQKRPHAMQVRIRRQHFAQQISRRIDLPL